MGPVQQPAGVAGTAAVEVTEVAAGTVKAEHVAPVVKMSAVAPVTGDEMSAALSQQVEAEHLPAAHGDLRWPMGKTR